MHSVHRLYVCMVITEAKKGRQTRTKDTSEANTHTFHRLYIKRNTCLWEICAAKHVFGGSTLYVLPYVQYESAAVVVVVVGDGNIYRPRNALVAKVKRQLRPCLIVHSVHTIFRVCMSKTYFYIYLNIRCRFLPNFWSSYSLNILYVFWRLEEKKVVCTKCKIWPEKIGSKSQEASLVANEKRSCSLLNTL